MTAPRISRPSVAPGGLVARHLLHARARLALLPARHRKEHGRMSLHSLAHRCTARVLACTLPARPAAQYTCRDGAGYLAAGMPSETFEMV